MSDDQKQHQLKSVLLLVDDQITTNVAQNMFNPLLTKDMFMHHILFTVEMTKPWYVV